VSPRELALVDGDWLQERLGDPDLVICEVDERPLIYRLGHIPGAHCLDWRADLQDSIARDLPDSEALARLWERMGLREHSTVVLYGDQSNWYACFGYWLFKLYGVENLRILDGGRQVWVREGRPMTREAPREDGRGALAPGGASERYRAGWRDVQAAAANGTQLLDVRTAAEYRGDVLAEAGYADEGAQRAGHIPGALSVPWDITVDEDGRLLDEERLRGRLAARGVDLSAPAITYCRIGERSAHTWFVLHELLGVEARNYDGSWVEWGSMIGMPIATGDQPG
jgi:thiosulfate/3-mercaptopyruvate sulfurtransferase